MTPDPNDCYEGDGEDYRGNVSETEDGDECLYWNSHFILENGADPFSDLENDDGLGPHNFCRSARVPGKTAQQGGRQTCTL